MITILGAGGAIGNELAKLLGGAQTILQARRPASGGDCRRRPRLFAPT